MVVDKMDEILKLIYIGRHKVERDLLVKTKNADECFSTKSVWECICIRAPEVHWSK